MPYDPNDPTYEPTRYKSLKELRKGVGKKPPVPPPPANGGSYSSAGGYGAFGTNDGGFGSPSPPDRPGSYISQNQTQTQSHGQQPRRGWSGSVENRMRNDHPPPTPEIPSWEQQYRQQGSAYGQQSYPPQGQYGQPPLDTPGSIYSQNSYVQEPAAMSPAAQSTASSRFPFGRSGSTNTSTSTPDEHHGSGSGSRWGLGFGKKGADATDSATSSRSNSLRRNAGDKKASGSEKKTWAARSNSSNTKTAVPPTYPTRDPETGRYIPPSERAPVDPKNDPNNQSWTDWASSGASNAWNSTAGTASSAWNSTTKAASDSWDKVNDAHKRDQALGAVGNGAAKVVGGALKYTAKGIWAVGKAAVK